MKVLYKDLIYPRVIPIGGNSFSALLLSVIEQMITDRNITDYYAVGAFGSSIERKAEFERSLGLADSEDYVSEHKTMTCMKERNARLVELASDYCICYWNTNDFRSGTGQTVRMAHKKPKRCKRHITIITGCEKTRRTAQHAELNLSPPKSVSVYHDLIYFIWVGKSAEV